MFSEMGKYEACGMFTQEHFILITITIIIIAIAIKNTEKKDKEQVHKIIRNLTITMWILETVKIIFNIIRNSIQAVNNYIPLYYCSILLYAGLLSSFGKDKLKRTGDVFLATGSIVGGIIFILLPTTSLPSYPVFHFISIYSFIFHGTMVYLGILVNKTDYIKLEKNDIKYFIALVGILCIIALMFNSIFDSNLMFISKNFPNTPIALLYELTNGTILFSIMMILIQITLPFYVPYYIIKKLKEKNAEIEVEEEKLEIC